MGRNKLDFPRKNTSFRLSIDLLDDLRFIAQTEFTGERPNKSAAIEMLIKDWTKRYETRLKRREKEKQLRIFK